MAPIRVLFVVKDLAMGGVAKALCEYLSALRGQSAVSCAVLCITPITQRWILDFFAELGVEFTEGLVVASPPKNAFFLSKWLCKLRRHGQKKALMGKLPAIFRPYDVLIDFYALECLPILRHAGKPLIAWVHTAYRSFFQENLAFKATLREYHMPHDPDALLACYERIVCLTDAFKRACMTERYMLSNRMVSIYNPLSISEISSTPPDPLYEAEAPYFIAVQRLAVDKAVHTVIAAFMVFLQSHPGYKLYIVGDGPLRPRLQEQAGACPQIVFTGQIDHPFPLVKHAKALILSSSLRYGEGLGQVLIEAQALGVPCIASEVESGPAEILLHGEAGYLFEPENAGSLLAAMEALVSCPQATAAKVRAASAALERFSPGAVASRFLSLIADCMPASSAPGADKGWGSSL